MPQVFSVQEMQEVQEVQEGEEGEERPSRNTVAPVEASGVPAEEERGEEGHGRSNIELVQAF